MRNILLVLTAFLFLMPYELLAENTITSIDKNWSNKDERSISSIPQLSIDNQNIYIYSEKALNDLEVMIKDSLGNILYYNVVTVSSCIAYPISISDLKEGEYAMQIIKEDKCINSSIHIEE